MCRSAKVKTVLAGGGMDDASLNESAIKPQAPQAENTWCMRQFVYIVCTI